MEVNCVDPALKVPHTHSEQLPYLTLPYLTLLSQRPNVDPSNIDEALEIGNLLINELFLSRVLFISYMY